MIRRFVPIVSALPLVVLCLTQAKGMTVRPLNISEMVQYADRVFYGKCVSAGVKTDPNSGFSVREYRFVVVEGLKGVVADEVVVVRQLLSMTSSGPAIAGIPTYHKGQGVLLFLHGDSRLGLTSPVGMSQGTFRPERLKNGELAFRNFQSNRNLTHDLDQDSAAAQVLSREELDSLRSGQPVPLTMLSEMVHKLSVLHEREGGAVQ